MQKIDSSWHYLQCWIC